MHRIRRAGLNPFFSKQSVQQLAPFMQKSVDKLCSRLEEKAETKESVDLKYIYCAFAGDVIREYCFSRSFSQLSMPDYNAKATDNVYNFLEMSLLVSISSSEEYSVDLLSDLSHPFYPHLPAFITC